MRRLYHAQNRSKKPLMTAIAAATAAAVMLGGAFAWTDFTQSKVNKFRGSMDADVTLHDEFDATGNLGVFEKDVFVENSGERSVYVRVRLDEYMKVGDTVFDPNADIRDKNTWTPHVYGSDLADCSQCQDNQFHAYYTWNLSGNARHYLPGTPGMVYTTLGADGRVNREPSGGEATAPSAKPVSLSKFLQLKTLAESQEALEHGIEAVLTEASDLALWEGASTGCWILDDTDAAEYGGGWAYWSQPLASGMATNRLLESVTLTQDPVDDWIYRIDVKLQAVTANDFEKWNGDGFGYSVTEQAQALITQWSRSAESADSP